MASARRTSAPARTAAAGQHTSGGGRSSGPGNDTAGKAVAVGFAVVLGLVALDRLSRAWDRWTGAGGAGGVADLARLAGVVVVLFGALAGVAWWSWWRRDRQVRRLEAAVTVIVGAFEPRPGQRRRRVVRARRWRTARWLGRPWPTELLIRYPAVWYPDVRLQGGLRQVLVDKTGVVWDDGEWHLDRDWVRFREIGDPVEQRRRQVADRLEAALVELVGGRPARGRLVRVAAWREGRPEELVVRWPAGWHADDRRRAALVEVVADKADIVVESTWEPSRDRVLLRALPPPPLTEERPEAEHRVEALLAQMRLETRSVTVTEWTDADPAEPAVVVVTYSTNARAATSRYQLFVEQVVGVSLPGRWTAQWDLEGESVQFRRRPELPTLVPYPTELLRPDPTWEEEGLVLPFGVTGAGDYVYWRTARSPHFLVAGPTNGGKTTLMRSLVYGALNQGAEVPICDPKWIEFWGMRGLPGVSRVASSAEDMIDTAKRVHGEMMNRYSKVQRGEVDVEDLHHIVLVIDEFLMFRWIVNEWWAVNKKDVKGTGRDHPVLGMITGIAAMGRTCRVHQLLGTQRPDTEFFGPGARDNYGARATVGRLSPDGATMVWNDHRLGTDIPNRLRGRGVAEDDNDQHAEIQVIWSPDPEPRRLEKLSAEDRALLDALRPDPDLAPDCVVPPLNDADGPTQHQVVVEPTPAAAVDREPSVDVDAGAVLDWVDVDQVDNGDQVVIDEDGVERTVMVMAADYEGDGSHYWIEWDDGRLSLPVEEQIQRVVVTAHEALAGV